MLTRPHLPANHRPQRGELEVLNAVLVSPAQVETARRLIEGGAPASAPSPVATLEAYAADCGFADPRLAAAALRARAGALAAWGALHDPWDQSSTSAALEAAARHPLIDCGDGAAFEAAAFQELILFLEELPW